MLVKRVVALPWIGLLGFAAAATAQVTPLGTEFQVNTYTTGYQAQGGRAICHDGNGDFVIVWQSGMILEDVDGDGPGIFAQRYGSAGNEVGTEFQVNSFTSGYQVDPAVCCQENGNFVVAWSQYNGVEVGEQLLVRRFNSSGLPLATEFQVNAYTTELGFNPDVCCGQNGNFVVAWNAFPLVGSFRIKARAFNSSGTPQTGAFVVNNNTDYDAFAPGVCCNAAGDFVVAWDQYNSDSIFDVDVFGGRFASNGAPQGTEFQVNTYTTDFQGEALFLNFGKRANQALCCDPAGDFVVAWASSLEIFTNIEAQRFTSSGGFAGSEFQINDPDLEYRRTPAACCGPDGGFVVVWASDENVFDSDQFQVFGRRFSSDGTALSGQFQVNTYTTGSMYFPTTSCAQNGDFVVSWTQQPQEDGDGYGVFARRFGQITTLPSPVMSWLGLGAAAAMLLKVGINAARRRKR